jgi:DNA-binding GntR family transcriptional regulator
MAQSTESTPAPAGLAPDLARADDLPLGAQLAWRLRVLIASGQLGPGDRLPGVRELASGTGVNVNTLLSRKHDAVQHLRERLQDVYDEFTKS